MAPEVENARLYQEPHEARDELETRFEARTVGHMRAEKQLVLARKLRDVLDSPNP
tara:strand:+ start:229 stop:393 length:165 start_codon:yes stop_codon:yes gene_type:complete